MSQRGHVSQYDARGRVAVEVIDVPLGVVGVGDVSEFCEEENGMVVVSSKGLVVHEE